MLTGKVSKIIQQISCLTEGVRVFLATLDARLNTYKVGPHKAWSQIIGLSRAQKDKIRPRQHCNTAALCVVFSNPGSPERPDLLPKACLSSFRL